MLESLQKTEPWARWTPDARGSKLAREAICRYEMRKGFACEPAEFILTASTSEAYSLLFRTICDTYDAIMVPRPGYPLLDVLAELDHLECIGYDLNSAGWGIDWQSLEQAPSHARAVLVVNPNNPTGSVLSVADWARLTAFCKARGLAIIVDEVFADFAWGENPSIPWRTIAHNIPVFRLSGLSKTVGLPQLKLAWVWVGCPEVDRTDLNAALEFVADAYLNLSAMPESLAPMLLDACEPFQNKVLQRIQQNEQIARKLLDPIVEYMPKPVAGWYQCIQCGELDDELFSIELLQKQGVLVQPGYFFDFAEDGWLVFSLLPESNAFMKGIQLLAQMLKATAH